MMSAPATTERHPSASVRQRVERSRVRSLVVHLIFVGALALSVVPARASAQSSDLRPVAWVNDEPVTAHEFAQEMETHRADVFADFSAKYQIADTSQFWSAHFAGTDPAARLQAVTLAHLVESKIQLLQLKGAGLLRDISYEGFLEDFARENAERRTALNAGRVIFGPQQFGEHDYFVHRLGVGVASLKNRWANDRLRIDECELRRAFAARLETNQDATFEELKDAFALQLRDEKYAVLLAEEIKRARVRIDQAAIAALISKTGQE